jgi:hypothetical protein
MGANRRGTIVSKRTIVVAVLALAPVIWLAHGQVSESELGSPGTVSPPRSQGAPAFPPPTIERPPVQAPPPEPAPEPVQTPEPPPAAPAPEPAPVQPDRNRVQSGKPVAAFWTVMPGR